ncbi:MAG: hypothetical protein HMLKMBBP_02741 [Planctomycetes bacterium]|nr:hypothetical protein [Planctomycetota bacterium]
MTRAVLLALAAAACSSPDGAPGAAGDDRRVRGTASYRERILLPADTELVAEVHDPLLRGITDGVVARQRTVIGGANPASFDLTVPEAVFDPARAYELTVAVFAGGEAWARTPAPVPVLTRGAPSEVAVELRR